MAAHTIRQQTRLEHADTYDHAARSAHQSVPALVCRNAARKIDRFETQRDGQNTANEGLEGRTIACLRWYALRLHTAASAPSSSSATAAFASATRSRRPRRDTSRCS